MHPAITPGWIATAACVYLNGYELELPAGVELTEEEHNELNAAIMAYNQQRLADERAVGRSARQWHDWEENSTDYCAQDEP